jgi:hypothetical protein
MLLPPHQHKPLDVTLLAQQKSASVLCYLASLYQFRRSHNNAQLIDRHSPGSSQKMAFSHFLVRRPRFNVIVLSSRIMTELS